MGKGILGAIVVSGGCLALVGTAVVASAMSALGTGGAPAASAAATSAIPPAMLMLYQPAAATCPGLPWTIVAAIGTVESDNGQSNLPGVHSGANSAGAEGPMQFEPATFAAYDQPIPPGGATPPSPYDPTDAVYAAARLLCANGGSGGADLPGAVYDYNHSEAYVAQVLALAQTFASASTAGTTAVGVAVKRPRRLAVSWALSQIGTPYVWAGETPGVGFDCSGLVQAAYAVAGLALPRVAQDQYDATPKLACGIRAGSGRLVFLAAVPTPSTTSACSSGWWMEDVMVDAPAHGCRRAGRAFPATPGASFGSLLFVGATRPV